MTQTSAPATVHEAQGHPRVAEVKTVLKRGALLTAANWPVVVISFAAETTFQVLLAVPVLGAALLVAVLLGADLANLVRGSLREMATTVAGALLSEPVALVAFVAAFTIVLLGGSVFLFLVKGGTVEVLLAAEGGTGPIEHEPLTIGVLRRAAAFSLQRYTDGCARMFRRYLSLGLVLMLVYALTGAGYVAFVWFGYSAAGGRALLGWTLIAATATMALVLWMTVVNLLYLLAQIVMAGEGVGVGEAARLIARFVRAEFRAIGGVFLVVLVVVAAATFASALAWSGVGLVAFVPLIGLAVFPLQIVALLVRGLVFEYIGLTAAGAYITLYRRHRAEFAVDAAYDGNGDEA